MTNSKILAVSKTCGLCHSLKSKIKKLDIVVEIREYSPDTKKWFEKHNLKSLPRLVIQRGKSFDVIQGEQEILEALKND